MLLELDVDCAPPDVGATLRIEDDALVAGTAPRLVARGNHERALVGNDGSALVAQRLFVESGRCHVAENRADRDFVELDDFAHGFSLRCITAISLPNILLHRHADGLPTPPQGRDSIY